ncbi:MAG: hypothetical protein ACKVP7_27850 [Hyphomicrobiaceae bacterium]
MSIILNTAQLKSTKVTALVAAAIMAGTLLPSLPAEAQMRREGITVAQSSPPRQAARPAARLGVDRAQLIERQASGYRQFTPARSNVIAPGTPFNIYLEPLNLTARFDGAALRAAMTIDLELRDATGQSVGRQNAAWKVPVTHATTRNGPLPPVYASLSFNFNQLPDGAYSMILHVNDDFGGGVAQATIAIQVQNGAGAPPPSPPPQVQAPRPQPTPPPRAEAPPVQAPQTPARPSRQIAVERADILPTQATGYRQFPAQPTRVVAPNTAFNIYIEPRNFQTRFDGSHIRAAMTVDFRLLNGAGQVVLQEAAAWKFPLAVASTTDGSLRDVYASLAVNPLNVPPGAYRIVLRVSDDIGGSSTETSIDVEFRNGTPQAEAPQAPRTPNQGTVPPVAQGPNDLPQQNNDLIRDLFRR